jgi:Ca-activated chloride channel family protein
MYQLDYPWLLLLLPLPFLVWWLVPAYKEEASSVRIPFFREVTAASGISPGSGALVQSRSWLELIVLTLAWCLLVLALARPQFVEPPLEKTVPQRDLMLGMDLSQSMDAKDFPAPDGTKIARIEGVRKVVSDFVKKRPGDRIGLVAFGDAPYPLVPFTMDHKTVEAMIAGALPGMAGPRTSLGDAIGLTIKMFAKSKAPQKVLILLTDGNDTASKMPPPKAAEIAKQDGITVHTVGIGDQKSTGEDRLDAAVLKRIAATTGGQFFLGEDQAGLEQIYATLDKITPANQKILTWRPRLELFHWPLGAALGIAMLHLLLTYLVSALRGRGASKSIAEVPA